MPTDRTITVAGITSPVRIVTDRWGVWHVSADSAADVYYGQGYAQARARLFQIDLWRRRGLGRLSAVLGADHVELDAAARLFLARDEAGESAAEFGAGAREAIDSFVRGVNARIAEVLADPANLPVEFRALGYRPELWNPDDVTRIRIHGLTANAEEEVARAITLATTTPDVERLRRPLEPAVSPVVPEGLDLTAIDESILEVYRAARLPVVFPTAAGVTVPASSPLDGSNNWAIAGSRTAAGRPVVASDPHRIMTFPSLRTVIHLSCPEFDVIGMNEPYLPGVTAGHNAHVAFGITIAPADLEDVYVYELHPTDDDLYRYDGGWERIRSVVEMIPVGGAEPEPVTLRFTRHGPVLRVDPAARRAFALRAAWLEAGMTPYLASISVASATSTADYLERLDRWGNPVLNHVVADTGGSIAWQCAGRVPIRPNWDGLLPVPGDGRYEWAGYRTAATLPRIVDPEAGWVRSANQYNLTDDPDHTGGPTSYEWYSGFRARRLAAALGERSDWDVESSAALQNDYLTESVADVIGHLATPFAEEDAEFARAEIVDWNRQTTIDSRAALIFDRWLYRHLPRRIRAEAARRLAPGAADQATAILLDVRRMTLGDPRPDIALLAESASWAPSTTFRSTRHLIEQTLAATVRELSSEFGDAAGWAWGAAHVSHLKHPLHGVPGIAAELTDTGRHPKNGSSDTVGVAFGADGVQTLGANTRVVMDVGDWDRSVYINSPGQDGDLESSAARDQFAEWLADATRPLLFSAPAIAAATVAETVLLPEV